MNNCTRLDLLFYIECVEHALSHLMETQEEIERDHHAFTQFIN